MTERITTEYIAGLTDGEGSIRLGKHRNDHRFSITITNTAEPFRGIASFLTKKYGGCTCLHRDPRPNIKTLIRWELVAIKEQLQFLKDIQPFSILKTEEIRNAIEFNENRLSDTRKDTLGRKIVRSHKKYSAETRQKTLALYNNIGNIAEVARRLNIPYQTVYATVKHWKDVSNPQT